MAKTVVGLFKNMTAAENVVDDLVAAGIPRNDVSIVAHNESDRYRDYVGRASDREVKAKNEGVGAGVTKGAGAGAAIGGGIGLVAGLASLAIPGFGPVIAAGPLAAALTGAGIGAAAGGLIGGLTHVGVPETDAEYYAEGVRRGGVLVTVRTDDAFAETAADIMERHDAEDVDKRSEEWRTSGWTPTRTSATGGISGSGRDWSAGATPGTTSGTSATREPVTTPSTTSSAMRRARLYDSAPYDQYESDFRSDFESKYASRGYKYDQFSQAYRFGSMCAYEPRYGNREWSDVEPELRRDWEARGHGAWEDFKDAVRHGWEKLRGRR